MLMRLAVKMAKLNATFYFVFEELNLPALPGLIGCDET